jgi:uncharacterized protein
MKIRSITCFYNPSSPNATRHLDLISEFIAEAAPRLESAGFEVQTKRLTTTPFPQYLNCEDLSQAVETALAMEKDVAKRGFSYLSLGAALPSVPQSYPVVPAVLEKSRNIFFCGIMATSQEGIHLPAVRACSQIITRCAPISPDGFTNLNFGALANVGPGGPFYPGSYHGSGGPACGFAIQCADEAVRAFQSATSLAEARQRLLFALEDGAATMSAVIEPLCQMFGLHWNGFDFSPAPFPVDDCSLGGAIEILGSAPVGYPGSLAAAAVVADTLDKGRWKHTGFNGLMMPVLEDSILAARSDQQVLEIKDLLLYSAVCGTGLDTVPLPGDATPEQLEAVLLDIAALAVRLGKPLCARLMPVPGKKAGDRTEFDFGYFANGRVMKLPSFPRKGLMTGDETFLLTPRPRQ